MKSLFSIMRARQTQHLLFKAKTFAWSRYLFFPEQLLEIATFNDAVFEAETYHFIVCTSVCIFRYVVVVSDLDVMLQLTLFTNNKQLGSGSAAFSSNREESAQLGRLRATQ